MYLPDNTPLKALFKNITHSFTDFYNAKYFHWLMVTANNRCCPVTAAPIPNNWDVAPVAHHTHLANQILASHNASFGEFKNVMIYNANCVNAISIPGGDDPEFPIDMEILTALKSHCIFGLLCANITGMNLFEGIPTVHAFMDEYVNGGVGAVGINVAFVQVGHYNPVLINMFGDFTSFEHRRIHALLFGEFLFHATDGRISLDMVDDFANYVDAIPYNEWQARMNHAVTYAMKVISAD